MEEIDPDEVMLNPELLRRMRDERPDYGIDGLFRILRECPLTDEELAEFGNHRRRTKAGMTISPMFKLKEFGRKSKDPALVPFIGIQGTF